MSAALRIFNDENGLFVRFRVCRRCGSNHFVLFFILVRTSKLGVGRRLTNLRTGCKCIISAHENINCAISATDRLAKNGFAYSYRMRNPLLLANIWGKCVIVEFEPDTLLQVAVPLFSAFVVLSFVSVCRYVLGVNTNQKTTSFSRVWNHTFGFFERTITGVLIVGAMSLLSGDFSRSGPTCGPTTGKFFSDQQTVLASGTQTKIQNGCLR